MRNEPVEVTLLVTTALEQLNICSDITLVGWDLPRNDMPVWRALWELSRDPSIDLIDAETATPARREAIAREAVLPVEGGNLGVQDRDVLQ